MQRMLSFSVNACVLICAMLSFSVVVVTHASAADADSAVTAAEAETAAETDSAVRIDEGSNRAHMADDHQVWSEVRDVFGTEPVRLVMALKVRNLDELDKLFWAISDPDSNKYGQYMTNQQITDQFGAKLAETQKLELLLTESYHAHSVDTTALRDFMFVNLSAADAERLLSVKLCYWTRTKGTKGTNGKHKTEIVRACGTETTAYMLPAALAGTVASVNNVINFPPFVNFKTNSNKAAAYQPNTPVSTPEDLRKIYGVPSGLRVSGQNMTQMVFAAVQQHVSENDLNAFFKNVFPEGKDYKLTFVNDHDRPDHPGGEAMLDIEWILSMGVGAPTIFYYDLLFWDALFSWLSNQKAPPLVVSVSYGSMEWQMPDAMLTQWSNGFKKHGLRGVTFSVASGDSGAGCHQNLLGKEKFAPTFPAAAPYVLSVGGTKRDQRGNWTHQVAIAFSGGGFSEAFKRPDFQNNLVNQYLNSNVTMPSQKYWNRAGRGIPDVSLVGDNCRIWINNQSQTAGGTSATAPQWGGIISLLNDKRRSVGKPPVGFVAPLLYKIAQQHPDAFIDITEGNNFNGCDSTPCPCNDGQGKPSHAGFLATKGWDAATGLGAPIFPRLSQYITEY